MNSGDTIWRRHFYTGRCTLNGFIMTAYAHRFSVSSFPSASFSPCLFTFPSPSLSNDFGRNDNGDTAGPRVSFYYLLHFFVISKLIDRLSGGSTWAIYRTYRRHVARMQIARKILPYQTTFPPPPFPLALACALRCKMHLYLVRYIGGQDGNAI